MDFHALVAEDLEVIRNHPGVANAVMTNTVPLQGGGWGQQLQVEPGDDVDAIGTAIYFVDEHGIDTFGVDLIAGRPFSADDVSWFDPENGHRWPPVMIVSLDFARSLFPDLSPEQVIGKTMYVDNFQPVNIVGVIDRMQAAWKTWEYIDNATLVPQLRGSSSARYVIRAEPGYRDEIIPQIEDMLATRYQGRIIRGTRTMAEVRQEAYLEDEAMIRLLLFIVSILTAITGLGIVGLASFSVTKRTRQIGTRRALGATRGRILGYFMLENFMISTVGVVIGAALAVALNLWMVQAFNLAPLGWYMIPAAMIALWVVGQAAVYGPARRASRVSPAVATRTV